MGAGIAGLTAAAFCAKENDGAEICVLEAASTPGGLVKGRWKDGFYLDQGVRAFEDAGILKPMLRSLELDVPFLQKPRQSRRGRRRRHVPQHHGSLGVFGRDGTALSDGTGGHSCDW
ncbi:MAG: NAD(P)-binding protein [Peptoniphilaceae bacterium]|nr:NAD(P)-binding protein [Peptoniphilaceae bacterium]